MKHLKELFENEVLSDETQSALTEAFEKHLEEAKRSIIEETEVTYAKKLVEEKTAIATGLFNVINEAVASEMKELKDDIEHYKDLEIRYAKKLEEFKSTYAKKLNENFDATVQKFVMEEIAELKGDLEDARNQELGKRLFEAFRAEAERFGLTPDERELKAKLDEVNGALNEAQEKLAGFEREKLIEEMLSPLSGSKREVMKTILESTETGNIKTKYDRTIDAVLQEEESSENGDEILNEDENGEGNGEVKGKTILIEDNSEGAEASPHADYLRRLVNAKG